MRLSAGGLPHVQAFYPDCQPPGMNFSLLGLFLFPSNIKCTFNRCLVTPGIALSLPLLSHRLAPLVLWWRLHLNYPWNPRNLRSFSLTMQNPLTPQLKTPHISLCEAECQHLIDFYCCFVTPYNSKPILDTLCETATLLMTS